MTQTTSQPFERSLVRLIALVALVGFILSGCGGGTTAEPTPTAAPTASPTVEATDTDDTSTGEEIQNEAGGFALVPVAEWEVAANEGAPGFGGTVALVPEGADPEGEEGIFMIVGPADIVLGAMEQEGEVDEATIEDFLDTFLADAENENITMSDREEITIGGVDGLAVTLSGEDPDMGQMDGRVAVAQVDDARIFMMVGIGPSDGWEQDRFDQVLESVRFFEPAEGDIMDLLDETTVPDDMETPDTEDLLDETTVSDDTEMPQDTDVTSPTSATETIFPLPDAVENLMVVPGDENIINYQTSLTTEEAMAFYREALTADGATERELLTIVTDGTFNLVFDNWPDANGQAVVVQGTPLDPDQLNVSVRLEDV